MLDDNVEKKLLKDIDDSLGILFKHFSDTKKEQEAEFSKLRRASLGKNKPYISSHSFYNFKQADKKLQMLSNMKSLLDAIKKVNYVK